MKAIIIPGNGNTDITENWFQNVKNELQKLGLDVIAENMPDPDLARKEYWLPFIKEKIIYRRCNFNWSFLWRSCDFEVP